MKLVAMIEKIKARPDYCDAGMILCHNGVVRSTTREGQQVTGLRVEVDHDKLDAILKECRALPGIIDILIHIEEDRDLKVGDDVMFLVVAGDIRENVLSALTKTLNMVKSQATSKTQFMKQDG